MNRVENKNRRFGQANHYHHVRVRGVDLLLTDAQWREARQRAIDNPEDVPRPWWRWLLG